VTSALSSFEKLPTSTFLVVGMWAAFETLLIALTYEPDADTDLNVVLHPILHGGIFGALLMVCGWLVFSSDSRARSRWEVTRYRWFSAVVILGLILVSTWFLLSMNREVPGYHRSSSSLLVMVSGSLVTLLLLRHYFRLRVAHRDSRALETNSRSEVSIRKLLLITALLASMLGSVRIFVGELEVQTMLICLAGCGLGLLWWATAVWVLGRRRYVLLTIVMFAVMQILGTGISLDEDLGSGNQFVASGVFISSIQFHLLLFLAMMRASQFRFTRLRSEVTEDARQAADPLAIG
jgi:hypothetical protein